MSKKHHEVFTTPIGEAVFPWLTKPDTQYDQGGVYTVDLSVPFKEAQPFIAKLEGVLNDYVGTLPPNQQRALIQRPVYKEELSQPDYPEDATPEQRKEMRLQHMGEPTGNVLFKMKLRAHVDTPDGGFDQAPIVVDAATGQKIEEPVYGGSMLRCRGQAIPYTMASTGMVGVTLRLRAVQVHELVTGGSDGGGAFWTDGFNDEA